MPDIKEEPPVTKKVIVTSLNINKAVGPYSHAVVAEKTMYISGVLGLDRESNMVAIDAEGQARQALENLKHVLAAGGSSLEAVLKTTVLLGNLDDYQVVNKVYSEYFPENYPARAAFQVGKLPLNALVEIEAIAIVGEVVVERNCCCPAASESSLKKPQSTSQQAMKPIDSKSLQ